METLHIGDHVTDLDRDDDAEMIVVNRNALPADAYTINELGETVAEANTDYPEDDGVYEVVFPQTHDCDISKCRRYAYPRSRLEVVSAVHD